MGRRGGGRGAAIAFGARDGWGAALAGAPPLSGILLAGAFPPAELFVLAFVALAPFIVWLDALPSGREGASRALAGGFVLGAVHFAVLLHWIAPALLPLTPLAPLVYVGAVGVLACLIAVVARVAHTLRQGWGLPVHVGFPLAWAAAEWLRGAAGDLAFPWLGLAVALAPVPSLAGAAELVGAVGVGLWIGGTNGAAAWVAARALSRPTPRPAGGSQGFGSPRPWAAAAVVALLLLPPAWGLARHVTLETREAGTVATVRTELPREIVGDVDARGRMGREALREGTRSLVEAGVSPDLVAWPETLLLERVSGEDGAAATVAELAREAGAPYLVGGYVAMEGWDRGGPDGNGVALFDPEVRHAPRAGASWIYAKRRLVPGVEAAPFVGPTERFGGLAKGRGPAVGRVSAFAFGPLICYESAFPGAAREARREGADVLVNATNDAWFGGRGWLGGRAGLEQHPPHLVLRALETRAGVVRSAQVGEAFFVDPRGRVSPGEELGAGDGAGTRVRVGRVETSDVRTFHTRAGDWVGWGSAALLALMLAASRGSPRGPAEL